METQDAREADFVKARARMVELQILQRGITSQPVLDAFRKVPRHLFVPEEDQAEAYADYPIPIGFGQTISQPYIVALMTEKAQLKTEDTVLEIGTGSGYQAAILSCLCKKIDSIERISALGKQAQKVLSELGFNNVAVHIADGTGGWPDAAPYDAILVTAGSPSVPPPLQLQLRNGGRLIIPVGSSWHQDLQLWIKTETDFEMETIIPVVFVPLLGKWGWEGERYRNDRD
ncbi:MAG: protein-L-isoaspartate(D-aspartate) O-methyltransferase [Anaerolineaceae bacterium]